MSGELVPVPQHETVSRALVKLRELGLDYGSFFKTELLKELAEPYNTDRVFPFFMMALTERLRGEGKILSSAELGGEGWRILQQVENYHASQRWHDSINRAYEKIIVVMTTMERDKLTSAEILRDQNWLRQIRHEQLMYRRREEAMTIIKKHKPGLLKEDLVSE